MSEQYKKISAFYNKNHKKFLLIPILILIFSISYIAFFYSQNGDFINKDISLTGGTTVTVYEKISTQQLKEDLSEKLDDLNARGIYDLVTREQKALVIETKTDIDSTKSILEEYFGYELIDGENSSFEFTGSSLSEGFYKQLIISILVAFIFMAIVVFILFRTIIPSTAVIISVVADTLMTIAFVNLIGMRISSAGIVAFLMLIGYSVDTDILLTTRILKRHHGTLNQRIFEAFTTGITMTLTSFFALLAALIVVSSFSVVLSQIFLILVIGLGFDIINTWITNVSILKWYAEHKGVK